MSRLIVAAICTALAFPVLAEDEGSLADAVKPPASAQGQGAAPASADQKAAPAEENASQAPADVDMANVRAAQQAASGVPATGEAPGGADSGGAQAQPAEPKSSVPLDKRQGGDITQCLDAGDKSDKAIAACAEKYRPHGHSR